MTGEGSQALPACVPDAEPASPGAAEREPLRIVEDQIRLAERLSSEMIFGVLSQVEVALDLLGRLRRDARHADAETSGETADALQSALLALLATGQQQDALRQVLDGVSALAAAAVSCEATGPERRTALLMEFDRIAERYVMEDQRTAHAEPGPEHPATKGRLVELF